VTTNNFFTSVPLFLDLLDNGIMAIGTLRGNQKYVPQEMFAKKVTKKRTLGGLTTACMKREIYAMQFGRTSRL
jgi:hypothetical protein